MDIQFANFGNRFSGIPGIDSMMIRLEINSNKMCTKYFLPQYIYRSIWSIE